VSLLVDLYCRSIESRDEKDTCLKIYTYIFIFALGIYFYICASGIVEKCNIRL